jgi:4-amino-4-deoxy-L-arabinose transferase-like glycosyltransferase
VADSEGTSSSRARLLFFAPILLFAAWSFATAGAVSLTNPDEGRYVEVAREMLASGDFLTPHFDGRAHWSKPPGAYWLIAASLRAFGPTTFAARVPSVLSGCVVAFVVAALARRRGGPTASGLAVAVFATMLQSFAVFRLATADAPLSACVAAALGASLLFENASKARLVAAIALGASFLVKGPIGLLVYAAARLFAWAFDGFRRPDRAALRRVALDALGIFLGVVAIGLPWFFVVVSRRPELLDYYLKDEVAARYFSDAHRRTQPWWFFIPVVGGGALPWTPLVVVEARRVARRSKSDASTTEATAAFDRSLLGWCVGTFVLFSIGRSKLVTYVLPLYPAAAVLASSALARLDAEASPRRAGAARLLPLSSSVVAAALLAVFGFRYATDRSLCFVVAIGVLALGAATSFVLRLRSATVVASAAAAACVSVATLSIALGVVGRADSDLGVHGGHEWIVAAVRDDGALPRGTSASAEVDGERDAVASPAANLALVGVGLHTLELEALGDRPEWFPHVDFAADAASKAEGDASPIAAFFARAAPFGPAYAVVRGNLVDAFRRAAGVPLVEIARRGRDRHAVVLFRSA